MTTSWWAEVRITQIYALWHPGPEQRGSHPYSFQSQVEVLGFGHISTSFLFQVHSSSHRIHFVPTFPLIFITLHICVGGECAIHAHTYVYRKGMWTLCAIGLLSEKNIQTDYDFVACVCLQQTSIQVLQDVST